MMGIILIILHLIISGASYYFISAGKLKVDRQMISVVFFIPFFGALSAVIITSLKNKGKIGDRNDRLEVMRDYITLNEERSIPVAESGNIVPLEDALIMDDSSVRRSVILDVLMSESRGYMSVFDQARMNDDVEVVHYATTAMAEMSKKYELGIQEFDAKYTENPDDRELLDEYIDFMEQYLSSNLLQGQLLEIQTNTYQHLLHRKAMTYRDKKSLSKLISSFLDYSQLNMADKALGLMEKEWPDSTDTWKLRFRYYYETGAVNKMKEMMDKVVGSGEFYPKEIKDIVSLWRVDERTEEV